MNVAKLIKIFSSIVHIISFIGMIVYSIVLLRFVPWIMILTIILSSVILFFTFIMIWGFADLINNTSYIAHSMGKPGSQIKPQKGIADKLLSDGVITQEEYDEMKKE